MGVSQGIRWRNEIPNRASQMTKGLPLRGRERDPARSGSPLAASGPPLPLGLGFHLVLVVYTVEYGANNGAPPRTSKPSGQARTDSSSSYLQ
ncbi:hypothetical protein BDV59DRAFT_168041 [Aspergillus ambiguus]|uniref:uncharacterized protein n=1 Tax=Aspergillus ambiguus TaxID=176160 RepID=UPI003CCDBD2C